MRWFTNAVLGLIVLAMAAGLTWHRQQAQSRKVQVENVRQALRTIQSEAIYHPAVNQVEAEPTGFATHIDPEWFERRPANALIRAEGVRCPWVDQPIGSYRYRFNPAYIVADADHAAFWYNPARGVVRARVPMQLSQKATVDLYNRVNGTALHGDEVAWNTDEQTAWVDSGPPEAVAAREAPSSETASSEGASSSENAGENAGDGGAESKSEASIRILRSPSGGK